MSIFGLLSMLVFLMVLGGLVALYYGNNLDLGLAHVIFALLRLLVFLQVIMSIFEFPCYLADGIVFISMGKEQLANIMLSILALILLFIAGLLLPKIKWKKHFTPTLTRLIVLGAVFVVFLTYNELFAGAYSFDSLSEYNEVRSMYEEYDDRFWPTKYIKHHSALKDRECISLCPFDVTLADGTQVNIYKGDTFIGENEQGERQLYYYPFTWKMYEDTAPLPFSGAGSQPVSGSDAPVSSADA